jgi:hypothetical protein
MKSIMVERRRGPVSPRARRAPRGSYITRGNAAAKSSAIAAADRQRAPAGSPVAFHHRSFCAKFINNSAGFATPPRVRQSRSMVRAAPALNPHRIADRERDITEGMHRAAHETNLGILGLVDNRRGQLRRRLARTVCSWRASQPNPGKPGVGMARREE